jgi:transcriptional regulator with XRE-family HTH domain
VPQPRSADHLALGQALRELREQAGYSQEELGFRAGLHRNYVGGCERGEINLSFAVMLQLVAALDVTFVELARRYEQRLPNGSTSGRLLTRDLSTPRPPSG